MLASEPPSSPVEPLLLPEVLPLPELEPLLLPEVLPDELPEELPDELPEELPDELPDELPLPLLVPPSSPVLADDVQAGCADMIANPPITATTADQANLFISFSRSVEDAAPRTAQFEAQ